MSREIFDRNKEYPSISEVGKGKTPEEIERGKARFDQLANMRHPEDIPVGDKTDYDNLDAKEEREEGFTAPRHR